MSVRVIYFPSISMRDVQNNGFQYDISTWGHNILQSQAILLSFHVANGLISTFIYIFFHIVCVCVDSTYKGNIKT